MSMRKQTLPVCLLALTSISCGKEKADLVLMNGGVYTVEASQPWAEAVVISGNSILAVLADGKEAESFIGPDTRVVDLDGKLAVPGFIDAHVHFAGFSAQQQDIMLMNVDSDEGLLEELGRVVPLVGEGEWITGGDWSGAIQWLEGTGELHEEIGAETHRWEPHRFVIDGLTADNPCFLNSYDGDLYLANTAALQAADLENGGLDGMEMREGSPTGLIYRGSPAIDRIRAVVKPKSEERILNEYRTGLRKMAEMGIVEFHDMFRSFVEVERFVKLQESGELTARVWIRPWLDLQEEVFERGLTMGSHPSTRERDFFLRFGSFKSANDGFLGSRGAMLFEPYTDRPDYKGHYQEYNSDSDVPGSLVGNPDVFYEYCKAAIEHGFSVDSHAIGDRGFQRSSTCWSKSRRILVPT